MLRAPAVPASKSATGKCPKCRAPFAYRDSEWVSDNRESPPNDAEPTQRLSSKTSSAAASAEAFPPSTNANETLGKNLTDLTSSDGIPSSESQNRHPTLSEPPTDSRLNIHQVAATS